MPIIARLSNRQRNAGRTTLAKHLREAFDHATFESGLCLRLDDIDRVVQAHRDCTSGATLPPWHPPLESIKTVAFSPADRLTAIKETQVGASLAPYPNIPQIDDLTLPKHAKRTATLDACRIVVYDPTYSISKLAAFDVSTSLDRFQHR